MRECTTRFEPPPSPGLRPPSPIRWGGAGGRVTFSMLVIRLCASFAAVLLYGVVVGFRLFAAEMNLTELPPPAGVTVDFNRDIKPIFEHTCFRCHGPEKPKSHFRLVDRESALKGGDE